MQLRRDKLFGLIGAIVAVLLFFYTGTIQKGINATDPGPRVIPYIAEAIMLVSSLCIMASRKKTDEKVFLDRAGLKRLLIFSLLLIGYFLGLIWLGFIVSTLIMVFVLVYLQRDDQKVRPVFAVIFTVIITIGLYAVFRYGFSITLPSGILLQV